MLRCTVYTDAVTEKWLCAKQLLRGTVYSSGTQRIQWNIWYTENSIEYLVHREIDWIYGTQRNGEFNWIFNRGVIGPCSANVENYKFQSSIISVVFS